MPSDNLWNVPVIDGITTPPQFQWTRTFDDYRTRVRKRRSLPEGLGLVHFFTEDYRFEQLWGSPERFLGYMDAEHWALTPDFSLYTDHPRAVHLWNVFRSRWLGAFWQRGGLKVIPTVCWADPGSYDYSFLGLPRRAVLAVSTVGVLKNREARRLWELGFAAMVSRLEPSHVVCYGHFPTGFECPVSHQILEPFYAKFPAKEHHGSSLRSDGTVRLLATA